MTRPAPASPSGQAKLFRQEAARTVQVMPEEPSEEPSGELAARLARRSAIQRDAQLGREPAWAPASSPSSAGAAGAPVVVHGRLDAGYPWALVFGVDTQGPAADLAVHTPTDNLGIAHNRATGTHGHRPGAANCHGGHGHRIWLWITSDDVTTIELLTSDSDLLTATAIHHDRGLRLRVFLAVTNDRATTVRVAHHLDTDRREWAREDLTDLAAGLAD